MFNELRSIHPMLPDAAVIVGLLLGALLAYWLVNRVLVAAAHVFARRTAHTWDDAVIEHKVVSRLAQILPVFIIYLGVGLLPEFEGTPRTILLKLTSAYVVLVLTFTFTAALGAANAIYEMSPGSHQRPIKGFVQLLQILVIIFGLLLLVAELLGRSPWILLSGFGAMTAVLLLVFKDTILSLVASVQLTTQDLVRIGDWIEVPQFGADGDVIDVQLHTVKVQNWDKTITTVPTHRLVSDSFKNWRGMSQSGGRRIKRSILLDATSIRFLSATEVERFRKFALLEAYIAGKQKELEEYNEALESAFLSDVQGNVNLRRLTNFGTFRAYAFNYLKHHPGIHKDRTLMVRQLASGPEGAPLELYCFTTTTEWTGYEGIQSDIFDHLLAIVPEFGLRLYQHPTGLDFQRLRES